ncbi:MAG TPA: peroxidase-related enzyme [Burkholderiales bacterium]
MSRIDVVDPQTATGEVKKLLEGVQQQLGIVPNFIRALANSPTALSAFLGLYGPLGGAAVDKATQERIALVVSQENGSQYCVSAHTAIGRGTGLSNEEMLLNRHGDSSNAKAAAAVAFAKALNEHRGEVTTGEFQAVRAAGFSDGEIVEIITLVALNVFTNLLGKSTLINIDFPEVALLASVEKAAA